jgi:hypothetical protein
MLPVTPRVCSPGTTSRDQPKRLLSAQRRDMVATVGLHSLPDLRGAHCWAMGEWPWFTTVRFTIWWRRNHHAFLKQTFQLTHIALNGVTEGRYSSNPTGNYQQIPKYLTIGTALEHLP